MKDVTRKSKTLVLVLKLAEYTINTYFSIDIILRTVLSPEKRDFFRDVLNWVDAVSIIPVYLQLAINDPTISYYTDILAVFRIAKVFRSFRYNYALQVLVNTLKESLPELMLLVFLMTLLATMFAFSNYFVESRSAGSAFHSIPHSLWWAFITMTTVSMPLFEISYFQMNLRHHYTTMSKES